MGALRDIITRFGPTYVERFGEKMPDSHLAALNAATFCRTEVMGGHTRECDNCGDTVFIPHSCRHRMCPSCHTAEIDDWVAARALEILPTRYFHHTFTIPQEFRWAVRSHQKELGAALVQSAAEAIQTLAADRLGGKVGIIASLHTWGRAMPWHPHVHCLIPGVIVHADKSFTLVRPRSLLPLVPLSRVFAGIFVRRFKQAVPDCPVPGRVPGRDWVVNSRHCTEGPGNVIKYLGRYAKRGPIADKAIVKADGKEIIFRYRDHRTQKTALCHLSPHDFLARYLQHTPPKGFHRIRYYGLLAPGARKTLRSVQRSLFETLVLLAGIICELRKPSVTRPPVKCPKCGCTSFECKNFISPWTRAPPT